ncbi:hypothetical protein N0V82_006917 [Gnomoniopsis sp. IMI 355080]|nr:hypothetical protein N0V82_006917 [Gnomoniopsis sp. IMI 355080]
MSTNQGVVVKPPQVETQPVLASYSIDADGNLAPSAEIYATSDNVGTFGSGVWVGANPAPPFEVHLVSLAKDIDNGHIIVSVDSNGSLEETYETFKFGNMS